MLIMIPERIINKIPGKIPPLAKERQGYIENLSFKTKAEIMDLIYRQDTLLCRTHFISKLPDKGEKIRNFRDKLQEELTFREKEESTRGLLSDLNLNNDIDDLEWKGQDSCNNKLVTENYESDGESDPLRLIANRSGVRKCNKEIRYLPPEESLIKPADLETEENHNSDYVAKLCKKLDIPKRKDKTLFQTNKTLKQLNETTPETELKCSKGLHWEVTAATPPSPVFGDVKRISIQESIRLVEEQSCKLKEIQTKHAAERLASHLGITLGSELPKSCHLSGHRSPPHESNSESEEEGAVGYETCDDDDEEEEHKGRAVIYSVSDS